MNAIVRRVAMRDHELLARVQLAPNASRLRRGFWSVVTHAGGTIASLALSIAPLRYEGTLRIAGERSLLLLIISHVVVQILKRTISRPRPAYAENSPVMIPDPFSFPSGHAAASASLALAYASVFPTFSVPILAIAALVAASRVVLGVHFPADVLAGQLLALMSAFVVAAVS